MGSSDLTHASAILEPRTQRIKRPGWGNVAILGIRNTQWEVGLWSDPTIFCIRNSLPGPKWKKVYSVVHGRINLLQSDAHLLDWSCASKDWQRCFSCRTISLRPGWARSGASSIGQPPTDRLAHLELQSKKAAKSINTTFKCRFDAYHGISMRTLNCNMAAAPRLAIVWPRLPGSSVPLWLAPPGDRWFLQDVMCAVLRDKKW